MPKDKKPLDLKRANIHSSGQGPKHRGGFILKDGNKVVGRADHSTSNDKSIQGSAQDIINQARKLGRRVRLKGGLVIDPADEDDDDEHAELIKGQVKK